MAKPTSTLAVLAVCLLSPLPLIHAQVFVVGQKSATADIATDFTPTRLELSSDKISERGRRELVRMLEAEQGFAHRALPIAPNVVLRANGPLQPGPDEYRKLIYQKGQAAAPGDRVVITALEVKADRIIIDLNGGPYLKHRFLSHIQLNNANVVQNDADKATGSRISLVFEGFVPDISAPELKALLEPLVDFGVKSSEQAYADTLPTPLRSAIAEHDVLVGMNRRMVLAALGAPESKMRERAEKTGEPYEEWIYGHVPQTVRFVRFHGDKVAQVEVAELGKPMEIHDKDEVAGYLDPAPTREIAMGDQQPKTDDSGSAAATRPTLKKPGEDVPTQGSDRVQFPTKTGAATPAATGDSQQVSSKVP